MQKSLLAIGIALCLGSTSLLASQSISHPFHAAQADNAPADVHLAVEIPAGSFTKYEINEEGLIFVDRFQSMPVVYPANYGSLPRTLGGGQRSAGRPGTDPRGPASRRADQVPANRLPEDDRWR